MTPEAAEKFLHNLAQQWRRKIYLATALKAFGLSFLATALFRFMMEWPAAMTVGLSLFIAIFLVWIRLRRSARIDASLMARHLNRTRPELEESCQLLLKSELTVLEEMQRRRVLQEMSNWQAQPRLPHDVLRAAWIFLAALTALALGVTIGASFYSPSAPRPVPSATLAQRQDSLASATTHLALEIEAIQIEIVPPAYTGQAKRVLSQFEINTEAGAQITWHLTTNQPLPAGTLIFSDGDTLALRQTGARRYVAQRVIQESGFYFIELRQTQKEVFRSDYHKIEVTPDREPIIIVMSPEQSRLDLTPGQKPRMTLQAVADDDYGLGKAEIIATMARGSGEAVKFREDTLAFGTITKRSLRRWELRKELDLAALGMAPGDELYFFIEAADNRVPTANRCRSETYFIALKDTATIEFSISGGLAVNYLPEYFRSQRQIIIDTEKLIAEKNQLSESEFKKRANNLGLDQQALRFRYSQYLGDEFEDGAEEEAMPQQSAADETSAEAAVESEFGHAHDSAENATLLAPSIKTQLKAAVAQMWDAELRLRTYQPEAALPHEYRALELLKDVQQRSRAYVQRVGFEPSPIKVDEKRLSGDLAAINDRHAQKQIEEAKAFANIRRALPLLQQLQTSRETPTSTEAQILEAAGQELARQALTEPGRHLQALQDLRTLITDFENKSALCRECLLSVQRAFWNILPAADPVPSKSGKSRSSLSARYFEKIGATR
ncbi:DUF4175 domain-containing protein [candidate division KSB1 bacterium]|nr:DUF4175 domain-containing protein [candidate division KSB1 bacterium]